LWVGTEVFQEICSNQEKQTAVLGLPTSLEPHQVNTSGVRYVPCPVCRTLMNRVNFANCSGVIIDVCRSHGSWFEREELHRIVSFIRAGGMDRSRRNQIAEFEEAERRYRSARSGGPLPGSPSMHSSWVEETDIADIGWSVMKFILRHL
jgi:Zn-finger nucleic acid-binding protein